MSRPDVKRTSAKEASQRQDTPVDLHPHEEQRILRDIGLLNSENLSAKWKIQLDFHSARSMHKPFAGTVSIWETGAKFEGDGDSLTLLCMDLNTPNAVERGFGCGGLIPSANRTSKRAVCPHCQKAWLTKDLTDVRLFVATVQDWAEILYRELRRAEINADIYLVFNREDMRPYLAGEKKLSAAFDGLPILGPQKSRQTTRYKLSAMVKDVSAGSPLLSNLRRFLTA